MRKKITYKPVKINISRNISTQLLALNRPPDELHYLMMTVDMIAFCYRESTNLVNRKYSTKSVNQFVQISRETLAKILGQYRIDNLIDLLIENNIIERYNYYIIRSQSRSYRLVDEGSVFSDDFFIINPSSKVNKIFNNLKKFKENYKTAHIPSPTARLSEVYSEKSINSPEIHTNYLSENKKYKKTQKSRKINNINISISNYNNIILYREQLSKLRIINPEIVKLNISDFAKYSELQVKLLDYKIEKINQGQTTYSKSESNGRLYHTGLSVNKEFMKHIKSSEDVDDNWDYYSVDISNSQWLLFSIYLSNKCNVSDKADYKLFNELCVSGKLYDHIAKELNISRDRAKRHLIQYCLFTEGGKEYRFKVWKYLTEKFPSVANCLSELKARPNGNSQLALDLQKMESNLMIDNCFEELASKCKFIIPRHDEIICCGQDLEIVIATIRDNFKMYFNAEINLKEPKLLKRY